MRFSVVVDTREGRLMEELRERVAPEHLCTESLLVGDVEIRGHVEEDDKVPRPVQIVIERKTEKDLMASLKDGRYHEQKARILATVPAHHAIYLVENPVRPTWQAPSAYAGAILHTMFRDGIHVAITRNVSDTADWVVAIFEKCRANPHKFVVSTTGMEGGDAPYISSRRIKTRRIDNVDPRTCYLLQLGQIPGVSEKIATSIAGVFPSWRALLAATDHEGEGALSKIPMIGTKKAKLITEYLKGAEDVSPDASGDS